MRVLMFGWEFPPYISGGLGTACQGMTRPMGKLGVEILFVLPKAREWTPDTDNPAFELVGACDIEIERNHDRLCDELSPTTTTFVETDCLLAPYMNEESYRQKRREYEQQGSASSSEPDPLRKLKFSGLYGANLFEEVARYAIVGRQLAAREAFDIIHAHDWMTFLAAVEAKEVSGKPLICHVHATEYDRTRDEPNPRIVRIEKYGMRMADRVITVSERSRGIIIKYYDIDPKKVDVVHNAVSKEMAILPEWTDRQRPYKIVLFLGRVTVQKGPDYFIEAARRVLERMPDVHFVIAGAGDLLPRIIERTAEFRLQRNIHFTGFLKGSEVDTMFALSDLYVMPSVSEPFGITPFEAMLHHIPVIVSKQSGITEVLEHAVKVDFWDIHGMADQIIRILSDDQLAGRLRQEGADELARINWEKAARKLLEHYKELVATSKPHAKGERP